MRDRLPAHLSLRDLGAHRLRDLTRPEQVFQLVAPDLPADFPSLRSLEALRHNLPVAPTALLGRERELAAVGALLRDDAVRLVTLTGTGGIGKTRLALQAAADALSTFPDGAWFVDLAPLSDAGLVLVTLALCEESLALQRQTGGQTCLSDTLEGVAKAKHGLSDYAGTSAAIAEAVALDRASSDRYRLAWHLVSLAFTTFINGDVAGARAQATESLTLFQELNIQDRIGWVLTQLALYEKVEGNYRRAEELLEEALMRSRAANDRHNTATALNWMSYVHLAQGQYAQAEEQATECLALRHELGDRRAAVAVYGLLADVVRARGDSMGAQTFVAKGLRLSDELGYQQGYSWHLRGAVAQALGMHQPERAARLLGAEEALREKYAILIWPDERAEYEQLAADTRGALSLETCAAAWAEGRSLSLEQAVAQALTV